MSSSTPCSQSSALRTNHELREALQSLEAQLHCLYEEKARAAESDEAETIASLVDQLEALYAEREQRGDVDAMLRSFEEQLDALYRDRECESEELERLRQSVSSLEAQVGVLIEERDALSIELANEQRKQRAIRDRAKALVGGLLDGAFVDIDPSATSDTEKS